MPEYLWAVEPAIDLTPPETCPNEFVYYRCVGHRHQRHQRTIWGR